MGRGDKEGAKISNRNEVLTKKKNVRVPSPWRGKIDNGD